MSTYTDTWTNGRGKVQYFTRSDGSRLRNFTDGSGPALVLLHTIRTQLDYFHRVIPQLWDSFTVYAVDLPGMGWSDIVPGARYQEADLRAAVVEFVTGLDLHDVTLAGESLGAALALHSAVDLKGKKAPGRRVQQLRITEGTRMGQLVRPVHRHQLYACRGSDLSSPGLKSRPILTGCDARRVRRPSQAVEGLPLWSFEKSGSRKGYPKVGRAIYRKASTDSSDARRWLSGC